MNSRRWSCLWGALALAACGTTAPGPRPAGDDDDGGTEIDAAPSGDRSARLDRAPATEADAAPADDAGPAAADAGPTDAPAIADGAPGDAEAPPPPGRFVTPFMPPPLPPDPPITCTRTLNVRDSAGLQQQLAGAQPGDCVVLADGNYAGVVISAKGTAARPIAVRAQNRGKAVFDSGMIELANASYVILEGLTLTTGGGMKMIDGKLRGLGILADPADHCRITRCTFRLVGTPTATEWLMLGTTSHDNRIDHCEFGPNTVHGVHMLWPSGEQGIAGAPPVDRAAWATGKSPYNPNVARNTWIDHNHFHDQAAGTAEVMVVGGLGSTGDYQDMHTVVEDNLFVNCDGDPEIVSVKGSSNAIRHNTIRTSAGMISLRAGNKNTVYGNFFFQGGKAGAGGIKLYEDDHTVFDNYIQDASEYPILVGAGDRYDSMTFAHAQVHRARIVNNTIVGLFNRPVIIGHGSTDKLPVTDSVFADNLAVGTATLLNESLAPVGGSYAGNIFFPLAQPKAGFRSVDPMLVKVGELSKLGDGSPAIDAGATWDFLTEDIDGQPRVAPDVGADEHASGPVTHRPLTAADVGPDAP